MHCFLICLLPLLVLVWRTMAPDLCSDHQSWVTVLDLCSRLPSPRKASVSLPLLKLSLPSGRPAQIALPPGCPPGCWGLGSFPSQHCKPPSVICPSPALGPVFTPQCPAEHLHHQALSAPSESNWIWTGLASSSTSGIHQCDVCACVLSDSLQSYGL